MNSYITVSIVQQNLYLSKKVVNNSYATVVMYSRGGTLYTHRYTKSSESYQRFISSFERQFDEKKIS